VGPWLAIAGAGYVFAADCGAGVSNLEVIATADDVSSAYGDLDVPRFEAARDREYGLLPCLAEPLTPAAAAAYHRVVAIDAFVAGDQEGSSRAFRSVVAAYPAWRLPSDTVPRNHPLRAAFDTAATAPAGPEVSLPVPLDATLLVDGHTSLALPTDRPAVLQWLDATGSVSWTRFLGAGEPPPEYAAAPEDARAAYLARNVISLAPRRKPVELVVMSGGLLGASAALYGGALQRQAQFQDPATPYADLGSLRSQTNGLLLGAAVAGLGGVGSGALAVVRW
jgi:hypothetical protein